MRAACNIYIIEAIQVARMYAHASRKWRAVKVIRVLPQASYINLLLQHMASGVHVEQLISANEIEVITIDFIQESTHGSDYRGDHTHIL